MKVIVTGGAGFIGTHAAHRYMRRGDDVVIIDNLSRRGADSNLSWLRSHGSVTFAHADIRDARRVAAIVAANADVDLVLHLAGQVAVTTSVKDPREDFEINALGTFNLLEAVRAHAAEAAFLFASTNKVYGGLEDLGVQESSGRYQFLGLPAGVPETRGVDFHSPYGCSKGAADQYVRDYARIYGLRTVCLRQSCIYGQRQFGIEDQGWVAWFTIATILGQPITVYGDGKQVRDVLYVDDLCDLYEAVERHIGRATGEIYNVGGGRGNQLSLLELLGQLQLLAGKKVPFALDAWRPGDQPVFVADITKAERDLGWRPKTSAAHGVAQLYSWASDNRDLISSVLGVRVPVHARQ